MKPYPLPVLLGACLVLAGCSLESEERMTAAELEAQLSEALIPGSPLSDVLSMINWIGMDTAHHQPTDQCLDFIGWRECGRILPAVFPDAKTGFPCNTNIVVVFRFDELDYLEDFVLHKTWYCV